MQSLNNKKQPIFSEQVFYKPFLRCKLCSTGPQVAIFQPSKDISSLFTTYFQFSSCVVSGLSSPFDSKMMPCLE